MPMLDKSIFAYLYVNLILVAESGDEGDTGILPASRALCAGSYINNLKMMNIEIYHSGLTSILQF